MLDSVSIGNVDFSIFHTSVDNVNIVLFLVDAVSGGVAFASSFPVHVFGSVEFIPLA